MRTLIVVPLVIPSVVELRVYLSDMGPILQYEVLIFSWIDVLVLLVGPYLFCNPF